MKILINKQTLKELNPCSSSWENYLRHHADFEGDITEFLALDHIPPKDKVWVSVRVMPRILVEIFSIDCAFSAADAVDAAAFADAAAGAADAADAADAAAYAAYAASAASDERERQLDAIAYLVSTWSEDDFKN